MADHSKSEANSAIVEAKAIILFYQDEIENLKWLAESDARGNRSPGDQMGRELDRWENHPEHVRDRFRQRAQAGPPAGLSTWQGWDRSNMPWSAAKHQDAVCAALFRQSWSMEDASTLIALIEGTWPVEVAQK